MSAPTVIYVTNSELGTVRSCEQRWAFAYPGRLEPLRTAQPLAVGRAIHAGAGALYEYIRAQQAGLGHLFRWSDEHHDAAMASARAALLAEVNERVKQAETDDPWFDADAAAELKSESDEAIVETEAALHLLVEHRIADDVERFEVVEVEKPFEVPLPNERGSNRSRVFIRGRMDLVLREWAGMRRVRLGEHKSARGYAHEQDLRLDVDPQVRTYAFALRSIYGVAATGLDPVVIYNVLRKQRPHEPSVNKDGTVSVAAIDTLRSVYEQALREQGEPTWLEAARSALAQAEREKPDAPLKREVERMHKAEARLDELHAKQSLRAEQLPTLPDRWSFRGEHTVTAAQIDEWREGVHATVRHQLRDLIAGRRLPVRNGSSCIGVRGCPYRIPCVDSAAERQSLYRLRVHRHAEALDAPEGAA